jgi:hypothetical protein
MPSAICPLPYPADAFEAGGDWTRSEIAAAITHRRTSSTSAAVVHPNSRAAQPMR